MSFDINNWYNSKRTGEIVIEFKGEITSELVTNLLEVTESKLDELETPGKIRKKVYNVLVETIQNLYHHGIPSPIEEDNGKIIGAIILKKLGEQYTLIAGNYIENKTKKKITERIDQINSLTKDELKQLYKMILNNNEFSEKGGGGLGMIDIARKTGNKLQYEFFEINEKYGFYQITVNIN